MAKPHKIVTMKLADLKSADYNPRKISRKALEGLQASLKEYGVVQPIVYNKRTKTVVGGHQRILALKNMGEKEAPVVVVDLPEEKEKALNVALNNPNIEGQFTDSLDGLLADIQKQTPELFRSLQLEPLESKKNGEDDEADMEFTEELMEAHNYLVLVFSNDIDWLHLQTIFPLQTVKALDSKPGFMRMGVGRVVDGVKFLKTVAKE